MGLTMQVFHFRVAVFPFILTIHIGFGTQLMETTKQSPTIKISVSQDLWKVGWMDIEPEN
jgi:hypothetical protein